MKKFILTFVMMLTSMLVASAGQLHQWTLYNFQGVWEIKSADYDQNLSWLVSRFQYVGNMRIDRIELALDYDGFGELRYFSDDKSGYINVRGAIFTPFPDIHQNECLSLLCTSGNTDLVKGLNSMHIFPIASDYTGRDKFAISSMNHLQNASAKKIADYYDPTGAIGEISAPAMMVQYQADGISIVDAEDAPVTVFGIDGTLHYQTESYKGETIRLDKEACYIIKAGNNSMKLVF